MKTFILSQWNLIGYVILERYLKYTRIWFYAKPVVLQSESILQENFERWKDLVCALMRPHHQRSKRGHFKLCSYTELLYFSYPLILKNPMLFETQQLFNIYELNITWICWIDKLEIDTTYSSIQEWNYNIQKFFTLDTPTRNFRLIFSHSPDKLTLFHTQFILSNDCMICHIELKNAISKKRNSLKLPFLLMRTDWSRTDAKMGFGTSILPAKNFGTDKNRTLELGTWNLELGTWNL